MSASSKPPPEGFVRQSLVSWLEACPACSETRLFHYCRVPSKFNDGEFIHYERCGGCSVVMRNPRMPDVARLDAYEEDELKPQQTVVTEKNRRHYRVMLKRLARLPGCHHERGDERRLFDFGCGAGGLLTEASAAGWKVMGLELSRPLAEFVEKTHGIEVFQGLATDPALASERFDAVVSTQVFEHLTDPRQTLRALGRILRPGGLMLIEVPNLDHLRERLRRGATMDDSHIFCWSSKSLPALLEREGFEVIRTEEGIRTFHFAALRALPDGVHRVLERLLALVGLRSGLTVMARKSAR